MAAALLCLLTAVAPLAFWSPLYQPYIETKEILVRAGAAIVVALLVWPCGRKASLPVTPAWIALAGLAVAFAVSAFLSGQPEAATEAGERLLFFLIWFAAASIAMRTGEARTMLSTALIAAGTIEALYVLAQFVAGSPLPGKWRVSGTLGNPDWTGEFLAVTCLLALGRKERPARLCLAVMAPALAATLARGAWLGFAVGGAAFLLVRRPRIRTLALGLTITVLLAAAVLTVALHNPENARYLLNTKSIQGRFWMWAVAWQMIRQAPWFGLGPGTFGLRFPAAQTALFSQGGWTDAFLGNATFTPQAHNDYLQIWAELGLAGLLAFAALVWVVLRRRACAADPEMLGCRAALVAMLVHAGCGFPLQLPASAMLLAVLLGTVETAACARAIPLLPALTPRRLGVFALAAGLCWFGSQAAWRRTLGGFALKRAETALREKQWDAAGTALQTATRYAPDRFDTFSMLGYLRLQQRQYAQALSAFERARRLGISAEIFEWRTAALARSGQIEAAVGVWNELAWLRPDLAQPHGEAAAPYARGQSSENVQ